MKVFLDEFFFFCNLDESVPNRLYPFPCPQDARSYSRVIARFGEHCFVVSLVSIVQFSKHFTESYIFPKIGSSKTSNDTIVQIYFK